MTRDNPRNISASIRQRLLNHSTATKTDPNLVLIWYALERFPYRLSLSAYKDRFVLKGAMLFRLWGATEFRSTKDLDLEGFLEDEAEEIRKAVAVICAEPAEDDGLTFDASSVTVAEIRDTQEYGGFRVMLAATLGTALLRLQIDVGFGDAITPAPIVSDYPSNSQPTSSPGSGLSSRNRCRREVRGDGATRNDE
jgi:Nucleotidyl transferase AbiEii toxin, Type IV TA system